MKSEQIRCSENELNQTASAQKETSEKDTQNTNEIIFVEKRIALSHKFKEMSDGKLTKNDEF